MEIEIEMIFSNQFTFNIIESESELNQREKKTSKVNIEIHIILAIKRAKFFKDKFLEAKKPTSSYNQVNQPTNQAFYFISMFAMFTYERKFRFLNFSSGKILLLIFSLSLSINIIFLCHFFLRI